LIHEVYGLVVIVIIAVFFVMNNVCIGDYGFKKSIEVIVMGNEQLGHIPATSSKILEDILTQRL